MVSWYHLSEAKQVMGSSYNGVVSLPTLPTPFPSLTFFPSTANCLGHYIFTETLLPLLKSTASSSPAGTVRIITTASSAHTLAPKGGINLVDQFAGSNWGNYGQSKLGNVIMSQYWSEKLKGDGIICLSLVSFFPIRVVSIFFSLLVSRLFWDRPLDSHSNNKNTIILSIIVPRT